MNYSDKLKDPRWQRRRLQIFERDNWKCRVCANEEITLCVHHIEYINGRDPWEYPDSYLITLCEDCHSRWGEIVNIIPVKSLAFELLRESLIGMPSFSANCSEVLHSDKKDKIIAGLGLIVGTKHADLIEKIGHLLVWGRIPREFTEDGVSVKTWYTYKQVFGKLDRAESIR